jgi:hypothetical protein
MEVIPLLRKPSEELLDVNLQPCCFVTTMSWEMMITLLFVFFG